MIGKQAKILSDADIAAVLDHLSHKRHAERDRVIFLASVKCGLRAAEIAGMTWDMVLTPTGDIGQTLELRDCVAKKGSGRVIPLHVELRHALLRLKAGQSAEGQIIKSERGGPMAANSIVNWFKLVYCAVRLKGCSSHSGRRTFITKAARKVHKVGGSLRDVQELAGHRSILVTQRYIEGDTRAKQRLVALI